MRSEIFLADVEYAIEDLPNGVCGITHQLIKAHGTAVAEEFIVRVLASVSASAVAALGQQRALELLANQLAALEAWGAIV